MDIEKLIERLRSHRGALFEALYKQDMDDAATALSTLQAENERLRAVADNWKKKYVDANSKWIEAENKLARLDKAVKNGNVYRPIKEELNLTHEENQSLKDANEKLRAELEQVKRERDAAAESIPHECKTCIYYTVSFNGCTPDHDCTNPDGGCSNNYDRWEWRGTQKED